VLGDCGDASNLGRLIPVARPVFLVPTDHAWAGVRDNALLPLLPAQVSDSYFKVDTVKDLMVPVMDEVVVSRADAGARVEAIRRGLRDPVSCRDAVVQLLRLQMVQELFFKETVGFREFNEEALRGESVDAVVRPAGLDLPTGAPR